MQMDAPNFASIVTKSAEVDLVPVNLLSPSASSPADTSDVEKVNSGSMQALVKQVARTRRLMTFVLILMCPCHAWICNSTNTSYFAAWVVNHGISETKAGVLVGVSPFSALGASLILPVLQARLKTLRILALGCLCTAVGLVLLSMLPYWYANDGDKLFNCLMVGLIVSGIGEGIMELSCNVLVLEHFADVSMQMMGLLEGSIGVGELIGASLGATLYHLGGYSLPTFVAAGPNVALAVLCTAFIHMAHKSKPVPATSNLSADVQIVVDDEPKSQVTPDGFQSTQTNVDIIMVDDSIMVKTSSLTQRSEPFLFVFIMIGIIFSGALTSSYPALLSIQAVNAYGWSEPIIGLVLGSSAIIYILTSVLVGTFSNRGLHVAKRCLLFGMFLVVVGLTVLGFPDAGIWRDLSSLCGTLALSASTAFINVPGLTLLLHTSPRKLKSNGILVALHHTAYLSGSTFGSICLLAACDHFSFQSVMFGISTLAGIIALGTFCAIKSYGS